MKNFITTFLLVTLFTVTVYSQQPGTTDKSYGAGRSGTVTVSDGSYVSCSVMQPNDKLVTGGSNFTEGRFSFIVSRYNKDGSPDATFGTEGQSVVTIDDLAGDILFTEGLQGIALQKDGKILATGMIAGTATNKNILLICLLPDGTPDESFGSHGRVVTDLGKNEISNSVVVQSDGSIIVGGYQTKDIFGNAVGILLVCYNQNGSLNESFGSSGGYSVYTTERGTQAYSLLLQPDDKIVAGGSIVGVPGGFFLTRYSSKGIPDESFGTGGSVKTSFQSLGGGTSIRSISSDSKNRIVAAGTIGAYEGVGVARYSSEGFIDNTFGTDGKTELDFTNPDFAAAIGITTQDEDKLIITSAVAGVDDASLTLFLNGLTADGSVDASFGTNKGQTRTGIHFSDATNADVASQTDGKIIVSGNLSNDQNVNAYSLTRFNGYPVHVSLAIRIRRWLQNHTLSWKGLPAEDKVASYTVEQSDSGTSGFTAITKVSGSANLKDYTITNSHLLQGNNYYRIKAVSTDGVVRYSEVVSADNTANTASVYPNPAKNYVTVQGLPNNATANIAITDGGGNVLARGVSTGTAQYRSSLGSNMQPGTYYLNITTGSKTEVLKFVKE